MLRGVVSSLVMDENSLKGGLRAVEGQNGSASGPVPPLSEKAAPKRGRVLGCRVRLAFHSIGPAKFAECRVRREFRSVRAMRQALLHANRIDRHHLFAICFPAS